MPMFEVTLIVAHAITSYWKRKYQVYVNVRFKDLASNVLLDKELLWFEKQR